MIPRTEQELREFNSTVACYSPCLNALQAHGCDLNILETADEDSVAIFFEGMTLVGGMVSSIMAREVLNDAVDYLMQGRAPLSPEQKQELRNRIGSFEMNIMDYSKKIQVFNKEHGLNLPVG